MYDLICGVPKYGKFIKDLLSNKDGEKLGDIVTVSKVCSSIIKKELVMLKKEADPGMPTVPVNIGERKFAKALCDLGSRFSLVPLSVARTLNFDKELKYTPVALQLADKSIVLPDGIIEDVLVQVDHFLVPADFIVMDIAEDKKVPLILGRPFLAIGNAEIRAKNNVVTFHVNDEVVSLNVDEAMKHPRDGSDCFWVDILDLLVQKNSPKSALLNTLERHELELDWMDEKAKKEIPDEA